MHRKFIAAGLLTFLVSAASAAQVRCPNVAALAGALDFPEEARQAKLAEGRVTVAFVLSADGTVRDAKIESSTHPSFDPVVLDLVARLKCDAPGEDSRVKLPVNFQLPKFHQVVPTDGLPPWGCPSPQALDLGYPKEAASRGIDSGYVLLELDVLPDGKIENVRTTEASAEVFSLYAVEAIKRLRCKGNGAAVHLKIPLQFRLR